VFNFILQSAKKNHQSIDEKIAQISQRRNQFEPRIRKVVRNLLQAKYGTNEAKRKVLDIFGGERKMKYYAKTYSDLFDPNICEIYLEDLRKIVLKEWNVFENVFCRDREAFDRKMSDINKYRSDAHAKDITADEMALFNVSIEWLEKAVEEYE
jgi:hypothetical protein